MQKHILLAIPLAEFESLIRSCVRAELEAHPKEETNTTVEYLSAKQAAAMLRISLPTLRKYTHDSLFKAYRIGRAVRYRRNEVEQSLPSMRTVKYSRRHA